MFRIWSEFRRKNWEKKHRNWFKNKDKFRGKKHSAQKNLQKEELAQRKMSKPRNSFKEYFKKWESVLREQCVKRI